MTDRMVVIHPQTSEFFNSPLTKCCFAACFRWGMVLNAGWIETSLETISFLAESYPLWRQENFYEETCSVLEKESPITNIIRLCCKETFYYFSWNQVYKILGILGFSLCLFVQFDFSKWNREHCSRDPFFRHMFKLPIYTIWRHFIV